MNKKMTLELNGQTNNSFYQSIMNKLKLLNEEKENAKFIDKTFIDMVKQQSSGTENDERNNDDRNLNIPHL